MAQLLDTSVTGSLRFQCNTVNSGSAGNVWYNSTLNKLQYSTYIGGTCSWAAGGAMIVARPYMTGIGTQNEALSAGGTNRCTEEYNGTSWSTGGALITARSVAAGAGTQNLGLIAGAEGGGVTEEYNGTTWSAGGGLNYPRNWLGGGGTQNAAVAFGGLANSGYPDYTTYSTQYTERYNGTSWSMGCNMITTRCCVAGTGTQNSALAAGGAPSCTTCTEEYIGTWSAGGALISNRRYPPLTGTQNQALTFMGGFQGSCTCCTEFYNGTSWSSSTGLITPRWSGGGAGNVNASLAFGGCRCVGTYQNPDPPYNIYNVYGPVSCTEEFTRTFATASV